MTEKELIEKEISELEESIIGKQSGIDSCKKVISHFAIILQKNIYESNLLPPNIAILYDFTATNIKRFETELHELKDKKIRKVISLCFHSNIESTKS